MKNKRDRLFLIQLFMTIECSQSVHSIVCVAGATKVARMAEQNWKFCSRFLRRKAPAEWRLEWIKKQRWK